MRTQSMASFSNTNKNVRTKRVPRLLGIDADAEGSGEVADGGFGDAEDAEGLVRECVLGEAKEGSANRGSTVSARWRQST